MKDFRLKQQVDITLTVLCLDQQAHLDSLLGAREARREHCQSFTAGPAAAARVLVRRLAEAKDPRRPVRVHAHIDIPGSHHL